MFFEQFILGQQFTTSSYRITKEEIIEYALRYDPIGIHIDEDKAKKSIFNGLVAAGLHTMSIAMKLLVEDLLGNESICGVGLDKGKFIRPVFPEDVLNARITINDLSNHPKEDRGYITFRVELYNHHGKVVISFETTGIVKKRQTDCSAN